MSAAPPRHAPASAGGRAARVKTVLVVVLVVVLATAVALVLAQSAGLVHLPFLGGTAVVTAR